MHSILKFVFKPAIARELHEEREPREDVPTTDTSDELPDLARYLKSSSLPTKLQAGAATDAEQSATVGAQAKHAKEQWVSTIYSVNGLLGRLYDGMLHATLHYLYKYRYYCTSLTQLACRCELRSSC